MGQLLTGLWDRAQGKRQIRRICNNIFQQWAVVEDNKRLLSSKNLYIATLLVYNSVNKQFLSPHKEPPSKADVAAKIEDIISEAITKQQKAGEQKTGEQKAGEAGEQKTGEQKPADQKPGEQKPADQKPTEVKITEQEFYDIIMKWIQRDMRIVLANRILLALLVGPLLAVQTKIAGRQVPRIRNVVDKVPTPVIASVYSVGLVVLQDIRMD